jgi:hypothetical protein
MNYADLHAIYIPGQTHIETAVNPETGVSCYGPETLADYPGAVQITLDDATARIEAINRANHCTGPKRVTAEEYSEALECLPPLDWTFGNGSASFKMCEMLTGTLTSIYFKVGENHYVLTDDVFLSHNQLMETYGAAMEALA